MAHEMTLFNAAVSLAGNSVEIDLLQNTSLAVQCVYTVDTGSYSLQLQESVDEVTWSSVSGAVQAVTATGSVIFKVADAVCKSYRVNIAKTSGDITLLVIKAIAKGC